MASIDDIWASMQGDKSVSKKKEVAKVLAKCGSEVSEVSSRAAFVEIEKTEKEPTEAPSAVTMIKRMARAVNQLSETEVGVRIEGIETLWRLFERDETRRIADSWPEATLREMLSVVSRPLLTRFEDRAERVRGKAIKLYTEIARGVTDMRSQMPLLFPLLVARSAPAHGIEMDVFVFDQDEMAAYRRGKAIARPDRAMGQARERSIRVVEQSEELRLALCELLMVILIEPTVRHRVQPTAQPIIPYFHEALLVLAGFVRDPFPELQVRAAQAIAQLFSQVPIFQDVLVPYATPFARLVMANLRHKLAKVRQASVEAIWRAVALEYTAKCRGAGVEAIADLVGFQADNLVNTSSFYMADTRLNYLADLTRDKSVAVRRALSACLADWFTSLPDRRDHQPRLLAYVLNFIIDEDAQVRDAAREGLDTAGAEWVREHEEHVREQKQYGIDGDGRCNHDPNGLPEPYLTQRPPMGSRLLVRAFSTRFLQPALDELATWRDTARTQSALLLVVLIVYCEEQLVQELPKIVTSVCKALAKIRREQYGADQRRLVLRCCEALGRYAAPDAYLSFLKPRVTGDLEVVPGGIDSKGQADAVAALAALLRGAKPSTLLTEFNSFVALLTDEALISFLDPVLQSSVLQALTDFITRIRGRAALEAHFLATGRLGNLEKSIQSLLTALLVAYPQAHTVEHDALLKTAIQSLAELDAASSLDDALMLPPEIRFLLRRTPEILAKRDDFEDVETLGFRLLEQSLRLCVPPHASSEQYSPHALRSLSDLLALAAKISESHAAPDDDSFKSVPSVVFSSRMSRALIRPLLLFGEDTIELGAVATRLLSALALYDQGWSCPKDQLHDTVASRTELIKAIIPHLPKTIIHGKKNDIAKVLAVILASNPICAITTTALEVLSTLLGTCYESRRGGISRERMLTSDDVEDLAATAHDAAWRYVSKSARPVTERLAALNVMWEYAHLVREDKYSTFVAALLKLLPEAIESEFQNDDPDGFDCQLDALLRALAVIDPIKFTECLNSAESRTPAIAALEDHASLLMMLHSRLLGGGAAGGGSCSR